MNNLFLHIDAHIAGAGFNIFGLQISWYGFIMALAMIAGLSVAFFINKMKGYNKNMPLDITIAAIPCAVVGARLYYVIFNGVSSFAEIFQVWNGGLAIYGGVIGGFLGICLCCLIKKYKLSEACDLAAPCLILGQAIGRIGCYFAGCCYGITVTDPSLQWFPLSTIIDGTWHLSTFFYESAWDLIGFFALVFIAKKSKSNWQTTASYFIFYGVGRAIIEGFRGDSLYLWGTGIRVSQALSILLIALGITILILVELYKAGKLGKTSKLKNRIVRATQNSTDTTTTAPAGGNGTQDGAQDEHNSSAPEQ